MAIKDETATTTHDGAPSGLDDNLHGPITITYSPEQLEELRRLDDERALWADAIDAEEMNQLHAPETFNPLRLRYCIERLAEVMSRHWYATASPIRMATMAAARDEYVRMAELSRQRSLARDERYTRRGAGPL